MPRKNNGQHAPAPHFTEKDLGYKRKKDGSQADRIPRGSAAPPRSENQPKPEGNKPTSKEN